VSLNTYSVSLHSWVDDADCCSYLPDLDALEIETLAATVTLTQRVMLLDILDHHVKLSPSIALKISVSMIV